MREYWINVYKNNQTHYLNTLSRYGSDWRDFLNHFHNDFKASGLLPLYRIHVIPKLPKAPQLEIGYQREVVGKFEDDKYKYQFGKDWTSVEDKLPGPSPFNKLTENKDILDTLFPTD